MDPWSAKEADEHDHNVLRAEIKAFVDNTDFDALYAEVVRRVDEFGVTPFTRIVRLTSNEAARQFAAEKTRFGLIHIDGNHDTAPVLQDIANYMPLLQPGGFLVMDDISWPSVEPALAEASKHAELLMRRVSADKTDDYAVLRKPGGPDVFALRARLRWVASR